MDRHFIQLQILNSLLFENQKSFSALNKEDFAPDVFNYHLQKLVKEGLIHKGSNKLYSLTKVGMEVAGRLNVSTAQLIPQPKVSVTCGIFRNNDTEVLVLKRTREPSKGLYSWLDRKLHIFKTIKENIDDLLEKECNLESNNYSFMGATHIIRLEEIDVILLNYKIVDPVGELKKESADGLNSWLKVNELLKISADKKLVGFNERLKAYLENNVLMQEFVDRVSYTE